MITPVFINLKEKKMVGMRLTMSMTGDRTGELWRSLMPRRKEIENSIGTELYSMQSFEPSYFMNFNPNAEFEKWAVIEVQDFENVPSGMEWCIVPDGLYAVFHHTGSSAKGPEIFQHIFGTWLPSSGYELDSRPHFEVLGEKYKNNSPDSEEEIWIPVRLLL